MTPGFRSAPFDLFGLLGIDRLVIVGDRPCFVRILQTFLEIPDAMSEIAHESRNLAAASEEERHDHDQDQPVPNAKTAHRLFLLDGAMIPREPLDLRVFLCPTLIFRALFSLIVQARQIMSRQGKTKASFGSAASRTSAPGARAKCSGAAARTMAGASSPSGRA